MPFLFRDNKEELFDKLEDYYSQNNSNYKKLIKYYKNNWLNNIYINYTELTNEEYFSRTNNYLERFHKQLFDNLECTHPKVSYLVDKYREYIKLLYTKITNSLINKPDEVKKKFSVIDDIINFITLYDKKYKVDINFNNILQCSDDLNEIIENVSNKCLDLIFENNPNFNDYKEDISLLNEEDNNDSQYLNDVEPESGDSDDNEEYINIKEFYPQKIKKSGKRNYREAFGEENEFKLFLNSIKNKEKLGFKTIKFK